MKGFFKTLLIPILGVVAAIAAPSPIYQNAGTNPDPIMIDATVFENTGTFNIGTTSTGFNFGFFNGIFNDYANPVLPFETQNTLYYTNTGTMTAVPGFNLIYIDDDGNRRPAANIFNGPGATIDGQFSGLSAGTGFPNPDQPVYGGMMNLSATNIVSRGSISGFYAGAIEIHGENVDLSNSKLGNLPLLFSTFSVGPGLFYPETNIRDIWWAYGNIGVSPTTLAVENVRPGGVTNLVVDTGRFGVYRRLTDSTSADDQKTSQARLLLNNASAFVWTNQPSATNKFIEVVFVNNLDTNVFIDVSWQDGFNQGYSKTAYVRFTTIQPDLVTQNLSSRANQFVIEDTFASDPLVALLRNTLTDNTQAPTNLFAFRAFATGFPAVIPGVPIGGFTTNSPFSPKLFTTWYDGVYTNGLLMTNLITTNIYTTWSGQLAALPSIAVNNSSSIPGASVTNVAGRVAIDAVNLNLRNARIQAQGLVSIRTDNLKSSRGAIIDAPLLNYDLGTTNGLLVVKDLAKGSISRFGGTFAAWSTTFTNSQTITGTNADGSDASANLTATYHVTVIQNDFSTGGRSVFNDLQLRSGNVEIQDDIVVDGRFATTAETLHIAGSLDLLSTANLVATNVPNLKMLENSGSISVPSLIGLGLPPAGRLERVSNSGSIASAAINFNSARIENSGTLRASGGNIQLSADDFLNNGGSFNSHNSLIINAINAKIDGIVSINGGSFTLNVPGSISDAGTNSPGSIEPAYGIILPVKPATGDLLGTTVKLTTPDDTDVQSFWAAEDLGVTMSGYTNNAALGVLSLDIGIGGVVTISPVQGVNAIYVQRLDLSPAIAADLENNLDLQEGMTLYFNSTSTNVTPAQLDGFVTVGGGTLRWVRDGSLDSTVSVRLGDGRTLRVAKSLRFSTSLDSDGDGVVNADDSSPFDAVVVSKVTLVKSEPPAFRIEWKAGAGQSYEIQGTSDLRTDKWAAVKSVKNATAVASDMSVELPIESGLSLKAYRVIALP